MIIDTLIKASQKPEIYTPGSAMMWVDEHISTQLLQVHLSQQVDLASRKVSTIGSTVDWILEKVPGDGLSILDLGCGPGLYAEKFAERGHRVTGMDFSSNSIAHAKNSASDKGLDIAYTTQDYLSLEDEKRYDLIIMIFMDFGVLTPAQRTLLLCNIKRALKPGGIFLFDVLNDNSSIMKDKPKEWAIAEKGFWRNCPYLTVSETFFYEEEKVTLNQHIVLDDVNGMEIYRFWNHTFSHTDLKNLLSKAGFKMDGCCENVIPDSQMYRSDEVTFCLTSKGQ